MIESPAQPDKLDRRAQGVMSGVARERLHAARRGLGWLIEAGGLVALAAQTWCIA